MKWSEFIASFPDDTGFALAEGLAWQMRDAIQHVESALYVREDDDEPAKMLASIEAAEASLATARQVLSDAMQTAGLSPDG